MTKGHIVLAHDLSERAAPVTIAAGELALHVGAELSVVHVLTDRLIEELREELPEESAFTDVIVDSLRDQLRTVVDGQLSGLGISVTDIRVLRGEPGPAIVEHLARVRPEYVVLGVRSRSRVGKLLFGSSAQSVLLSGGCKAVTVPI